jgi:hypothetical protein
MGSLRWFNPQQPQTLQGAVIFSYLNSVFAVLGMLSGASFIELIILLGGVGAVGIVNDRKWGYALCLAAALFFLVLQVIFFFFNPFVFAAMMNLLFSGFLVALLLHPASRLYRRVYFH